MKSKDKFWATFWSLVAVIASIAFLAIAGTTMYKTHSIANAPNPMEVKYAIIANSEDTLAWLVNNKRWWKDKTKIGG